MTPERWQTIEELFQATVELAPDQRAAFLLKNCAGDDALRREVEALLLSDAAEDGAIEEITTGVAAQWAANGDRHDLVGKTLGRYQILRALATGGMGEVFLAEDTTLHRKAALKLLPRQWTRDPDRLRRFEGEARAASALNHPNIITIYEIGEWEGTRFIASEFIEGATLSELAQQPRLPVAEILEIGCQAAGALAAAHAANIVHRDIKPANIMLRGDGYIKVLDFGLAKLASARAHLDATEPGRVMGTISYMSPEQALGKPLDHRTDIFSLGVVLYELATGRRLFEGQSEAATYDRILHHNPPVMRDLHPGLPDELDVVVRRALEKDPERRYQTAAELRADFRTLAQGSGSTEAAKAVAIEQRAARRSRHWRIAAAAVVTLVISAALLFLIRPTGGSRSAAAPETIPTKSLAVLPFANRSGTEENAAFTDGVQDQILTDVTKISELRVVSRTSVMAYKTDAPRNLREIGQQLHVAYLLEGSVQRIAGKVRVNTQLTEASSNAQVWAESYDKDVADVFAIQSEIAQAVASQLRAKLSPAEKAEIERPPTSDLVAFELFTRGKTLIELARSGEDTEANFRTGIDLLTQAVRRDQSFFLAYCYLARAHSLISLWGIDNTPARRALGQAAVDSARRLSPDSGDTHLAAAIHLYAGLEFDRARDELALAQQTLRNDVRTLELSAYIDRRQGRWEESTHAFERWVELDPLNVDALNQLASNYEALHHYAKWAAIVDRCLALRPDRIGIRLMRAKLDVDERADTRRYRAVIEGRMEEDPASVKTLADDRIELAFYERDFTALADALAAVGEGHYGSDGARFSRAFGEGMLARMKGDSAAAQTAFSADRIAQEKIVQTQPDYGPAVSILGLIEAALGQKEEALRLGRRAVELLPVSRDAIRGPAMIRHLAIIAAWVGEKDLALEQLRLYSRSLAAGPHFGLLKLDPMWDPLRDDPRFEEFVASLAPPGEGERR
ncbi:MAG: protein kinase [Verrucomicrobiota bacterium]|nr:protein kinase [Verrucomicrobiota bacterium]